MESAIALPAEGDGSVDMDQQKEWTSGQGVDCAGRVYRGRDEVLEPICGCVGEEGINGRKGGGRVGVPRPWRCGRRRVVR
jgi:hypothetical protein